MKEKWIKALWMIVLPIGILLVINALTGNQIPFLRYILAAAPILAVLVAMTAIKIGGQYAGPMGWLLGLIIAWQAFGITPAVFGVSQTKGFLLTTFVLAVFWPALFLYNIINQANGIQSIALALEKLIRDRMLMLIVIAWAFSALLEGLAGFGLPVAIVSPMLVGLGIQPVLAVTTVAVGHAWAVTFGDMGVVFQTLTSVVKVAPADLASHAGILLGIACLVCGLATAHLFGYLRRWWAVVLVAAVMAAVQYLAATSPLNPLGSFLAGLAGVLSAIAISQWMHRHEAPGEKVEQTPALLSAVGAYAFLAILMAVVTVIPPISSRLSQYVWVMKYPEVSTLMGFVTPAVARQAYKPLLHPGTSILITAFLAYLVNRKLNLYSNTNLGRIALKTLITAGPAMIGILSMVELSAIMDHSGMTMLLAEALSNMFKSSYPLIAPLIGVLGAFATGSNNNSNVLFGSLQENIALILGMAPAIIVSAQTTGGALGSMIAPAKIIVGCSTVDLIGRDGEVLRKTLPYGIGIALLMGVATLIMTLIR
jgi:lactate permease